MSEKYTVSDVNILQYLTDCAALRSPLSDFYVRSVECLILCARAESGGVAGFILAEGTDPCEIRYLAASEGNHAVRRALIDALAARLSSGTRLCRRLKQGDQDEAFMMEYGFRPGNILHIFRSLSPKDDTLSVFIRDNAPLCAAAEQRGFESLSLPG